MASCKGTRRHALRVRGLAAAFAGLAIAHAVLLGSLQGLPFQDVPNHLARAVISVDLLLHGGARFGHFYAFKAMFSPYIFGDLILVGLVAALGPYLAAKLWLVVVAASLPLAVAVYLRSRGCGRQTVLVASLLALYLGTDWFFLMGFQSFRLAVALTVLALAAFERYLDRGSAATFAAYAALGGAGYLMHLSALLFTGMATGLAAAIALAQRRTTLARAAAGALPLIALAAWHAASSGLLPQGATEWNSFQEKLLRLSTLVWRWRLKPDAALWLALGAACLVMLRSGRARGLGGEPELLQAAFAGMCLATYAALPFARGFASYLDSRALAFIPISFVLGAALACDAAGGPPRAARALAVLVAVGNFAMLAWNLRRENATMLEYRQIALQVPEGARVLPVATRPPSGMTNPFLHAGMFATIERGARSPYLFSEGSTPFFTAREKVPAPKEWWYWARQRGPDVLAIPQHYSYLLVMLPYDPGRIPFATEVVASNGTAALLRVRARGPAHRATTSFREPGAPAEPRSR